MILEGYGIKKARTFILGAILLSAPTASAWFSFARRLLGGAVLVRPRRAPQASSTAGPLLRMEEVSRRGILSSPQHPRQPQVVVFPVCRVLLGRDPSAHPQVTDRARIRWHSQAPLCQALAGGSAKVAAPLSIRVI